MTEAEILAAAAAWRDQDPDDETRAELDALLVGANHGSARALAQLRDRFSARLEFGTAGLRGALGAGPNRMNRLLVTQAAGGLAAFLLERGQHPSVVVGYDGRKNSRAFAIDTAEIMAGAGVTVILLPRLLPTPVLAFAVRFLDVSAGVMVTASHNPAADNGYKVYLGGSDGGSQIVPPSDGEIADHIDRVAARDARTLPRSTQYRIAGEDVLDAYVAETAALGTGGGGRPSFVYTAMHGVGWETASRVFESAGFRKPIVVPEQIEPDATFPTVVFPNPEEPGALDLAFERATAFVADLVIANDPDADRLAVGIPIDDGWRRLSGNEVGLLLGWRSAARATTGVLACSIVSSPGLAAVAKSYGLGHVETLTGFKWISREPGMVFGFEEALGYLVDPQVVRDKDGISAAVDILSLASELERDNKTLADHLEDFAARFGAFASSQISLRFDDLSEIPRVMNALRATPPRRLGDLGVRRVDDFEHGFGGFGPNDILRIWMDDGSRIVVRPSGTEPKLKVYIDASSADGTPIERMSRAQATVDRLDAEMRELLA
jgi:phosphomannomutase